MKQSAFARDLYRVLELARGATGSIGPVDTDPAQLKKDAKAIAAVQNQLSVIVETVKHAVDIGSLRTLVHRYPQLLKDEEISGADFLDDFLDLFSPRAIRQLRKEPRL